MAYPDIEVHYRDLPFPSRSTSAWLGDVDVATCHLPPPDEAVWSKVIRHEPRVALMPSVHRLAGCEELRRRRPARRDLRRLRLVRRPGAGPASGASTTTAVGHPSESPVTTRANPQEVLAALGAATARSRSCRSRPRNVLKDVLAGTVAIPLRDAAPSRIALVGPPRPAQPARRRAGRLRRRRRRRTARRPAAGA